MTWTASHCAPSCATNRHGCGPRAYIGDADPAFNNPSASLYGGRAEPGGRASWQLAPSLLLRGEVLESKDRLTGGERRGGLLSLESRFRRLTFEAGVRRIHETATPAQASSFGLLQPFSSVTPPGFGFARHRWRHRPDDWLADRQRWSITAAVGRGDRRAVRWPRTGGDDGARQSAA